MSDRLIYVVGTPSGGTSAVAGVLHHLGVDMGEYPSEAGMRGYTTFEDIETATFKVTPSGHGSRVVRQRLRMRDYIAYRRERQRRGIRIGTKGSALWWLDEPNPEELPIDIVRVLRPIEHAIRGDARVQQIMANDHQSKPAWTPKRRIDRAQAIAATWAAGEMLTEVIEPVISLHFADLVAKPQKIIGELVNALKITPSENQIDAAALFIDPQLRHF
jgi:hypothetical protein